ncbi:MAG: nicotinamide riboside transporter PnuC [Bacteroidia bacterium]|jgi:nicotinamide mononucleotide transporter|nr:nicotinamide riboside transporter PnuC [Bacteroidia bacterium]
MLYLEITAVVFSLLSVWFSVNRNVLTWPTGIAGVIAYFILFYYQRLYADTLLQVIFFIQAIYGWNNWGENLDKEKEIKPEVMSKNLRVLFSILIVGVWIITALLLIMYTKPNIPWADSAASTLSIFANLLLARRKIENWVLWIMADLIYIGIFVYNEMYLSAFTYFVFLIMATVALFSWKNSLTEKASS